MCIFKIQYLLQTETFRQLLNDFVVVVVFRMIADALPIR